MLTCARLREVLHYDRDTGLFTWIKTPRTSPRKPGDIAGGPHDQGYWHIRIDYTAHKAHRLAWLYVTGEWPAGVIDHKDGDPGNNRFDNLRDVTDRINSENQKRSHCDTRSGLLGATPNHHRWMAQISSRGKYHYLGTFDTPELAHGAYVAAKRDLHSGCLL